MLVVELCLHVANAGVARTFLKVPVALVRCPSSPQPNEVPRSVNLLAVGCRRRRLPCS